jgi:transcriptional antiterminator NusG
MADTVEVTDETPIDVAEEPTPEAPTAVESQEESNAEAEEVAVDSVPDAVEVEESNAEAEEVAEGSVPDAVEAEEPTAEADEPVVVEDESADEESEAETEAPVTAPVVASPYDLPGDWYVIHSYSGYENKVKVNLETRINSMHMEDRIFEVHIPMEDVVEFKNGKKTMVNKKVFPGYILVRMTLDDDSWYAVRNTPGVTGFVAGNAQKPTPLSRREVERFLGVQKEEEKGKPRFKPDWEIGEQVRVVTGPFADFNGVIEEINVDQQKIVVLVNIFGRDTPVELGFDDIQKN